MDVVDPRDLDGRELMAHLLFGDLPRAGWNRRGAFVRRMLHVAGMTVFIALVMAVAAVGIVLLWAAMQAPA